MEIKILKPEEIKQPVGALIFEDAKPEDWNLGGSEIELLPINPNSDWRSTITEFELQRNAIFDAYDCVTQSAWNGIQNLINFLYKIRKDQSKRYTAVISGTKPGQGNSVDKVVESIRTKDCVEEKEWVSMTPTMTQDEFFKPIPQEVKNKVNFLKEFYFNHVYLKKDLSQYTCKPETILNGLTFSPLMVSVEGRYNYDENGYITYGGGNYAHEVLLVAPGENKKFWYILDSENDKGLEKWAWNYPFGMPKVLSVKKKSSMIIYKKKGEPALYAKHWSKDLLIPFASSSVMVGGDMFKSLYGITDYNQLNIKEYDTLPYPIGDVAITTTKWPQ